MLPILRILPVGGVLLAILILVLALIPPDGSRSSRPGPLAPARGPLLERDRHAELRQFLIHAALKRADELNRLRDLPDTPARSRDPQVAGLPSERSDTDETAAANENSSGGMSVELGERSSAELPVTLQDDNTPASKKAPQRENRRRSVHRIHRPKAASVAPQQQPTFFDFFFGGQQYQRSAYKNQQAGQQYQYPTNGTQQNTQRYQQPAYGTHQSGQRYQYPVYGAQQSTPNYQQPPYSPQRNAQWYQQPPYADSQARQPVFSVVPRTNPY